MDNKTLRLCLLAGCLSLLMLSGTALAASIDTTKIQTNVVNVPATTVKAPVQVKPQQPNVIVPPSGPQRAAPAQSVQPKVKAGIVGPAMGPGSTGIVGPAMGPGSTSIVGPAMGPGSTGIVGPAMGPGSTGIVGPAMGPGSTGIVGPAMAPGRIQPQYGPKPTFNYPLQPDVNRSMPDANNSSGIYVPATPPPAVNTLGGPKMNEQALDRIQNIQEAATAAEVFDQIKQMKDFEDTMAIGAGSSGRPGGQTGPLGAASDHLGIDAVGGDSSSSASRNQTGMGMIDRSGPADPAAGSGSTAPGGGLDTSRQGWVSSTEDSAGSSGTTETTQTGKTADGAWSRSTSTDSDGNVTVRTRQVGPNAEGQGGTVYESKHSADGSGYDRTTYYSDEGGGSSEGGTETTYRVVNGEIKSTTVEIDRNGGRTIVGRGSGRPGWDGSQSETTGHTKYGDCVKGQGGCAKEYRTKPTPMQMTGQPSKGDADTGGGSSAPSVGTAAVTNPSEFHSRGGTSVSGSKMWEGITESGGTPEPPPPPGPSGANLDEAMGAVD